MEALGASTATVAVLTASHFALPDDAADTFWALQRWPLAIQDELAAAAERLGGYREDYSAQLLADQRQLQADVQQLQVRRASKWLRV
jgi:hypothetical protein